MPETRAPGPKREQQPPQNPQARIPHIDVATTEVECRSTNQGDAADDKRQGSSRSKQEPGIQMVAVGRWVWPHAAILSRRRVGSRLSKPDPSKTGPIGWLARRDGVAALHLKEQWEVGTTGVAYHDSLLR